MSRISGKSNINRRAILHTFAVLMVTAIALWPGNPVQAGHLTQQPSPITLDIRAGFDSYVEQGNWVPITITASNDGEDVSGELRIEVESFTGGQTQYVRPIELPRDSRKQVTLYAADLSTFEKHIRVDLVQRGRILISQQVDVQFVNPTTLLIGIWSDSPLPRPRK